MRRQRHDTAWRCSEELVWIVAARLSPEDQVEARRQFYETLLTALQRHDAAREHEEVRLTPGGDVR